MNLIKEAPIAHRHLFQTNEDNSRSPKTEFDMNDLWNYYQISFLGSGDSMCASQYVTVEAIEKRRKALLANIPPILPKQAELLQKLCDHYGLEVVLYAIDDYSGGNSGSVPEVEKLIYYVKGAEATLANIQLRRTMGI